MFVVASLNHDLNLRRLERYLAVAWESGAEPVIVLSKADLAEDAAESIAEVDRIAVGVRIITASAVDGRGVGAVRSLIEPGLTVAFIGSSGVGKSTLLNVIAGEEVATVNAIREDDARGRHTTTRRQLHLLPDGGVVLDTPGMRELAAMGRGRRARAVVRRHRGARRRLPVQRLRPRRRAGLRGHGRDPRRRPQRVPVRRLAKARARGPPPRAPRRRARPRRGAAQVEGVHKSVGKHMELKYGREA